MTTVKHQELILDAIDQLRHRKARPDAERIYNSLFRRHSISCTEAKIALEKCVETGVVLRVSYKGNISYRNAAKKYSHLKRDSQGEIIRLPGKPRRKFTALLTNAFAELIIQEPDYLDIGVPPHELTKTILSKDSVRYTKRYVSILLEKEVEAGGLIRMENGNFLVGPNKTDRRQQPELQKMLTSEPAAAATTKPPLQPQPTTTGFKYRRKTNPKPSNRTERCIEAIWGIEGLRRSQNLRVGGRTKNITEMNQENIQLGIKRAKKVFDPSDNNVPRKRGRPVGSLNKSTIEKQSSKHSDSGDSRPESRNSLNGREQGGVCSVCHIQNKKGPEKMVSCRECSNKAHQSCLNQGNMMLKMCPDNTWVCPHCKTCVVCYETSDAGDLVVCSICADAYHMTCHQPKVVDKAKAEIKWLCINCQMPEQLAVDHIQIGFNMDAVKLHSSANGKYIHNGQSGDTTLELSSNDDTRSHSPELSRNSSTSNFASPPPSPTPPTLSPQTVLNGQHQSPIDSDCKSDINSYRDEELEENIDLSIPDASEWTPDDVYQYFFRYFPDEAVAFREQEIDGHSLLLMKRMDVLKGLKLKLGPALKIYRHVLKLQYRRDDPKLYWV